MSEESASGLAYSATRLVDNPAAVNGRVCARTHVYFFLWQGHSDPVDYFKCFQLRAAPLTGYDSVGNCS